MKPFPPGSECPICGAHALTITHDPVDVEFPEGSWKVAGFEYNRCTACGEDFFVGWQLDAINERASAMARAALGRLAPEEIRRLRLDLGLTQAALERALGAGRGVVANWERGIFVQGGAADQLMRILWAHPELLAETACVAREGRGPYRTRRSRED
jgi:putative zinc finger/helix-turn-helix YgiT family protein